MISIIIVNYNVLSFLKECIKSIYNSDLKQNFEIIIIDNNSPEPLLGSFDKNDNIKIYHFTSNKGFAKAVNFGISKSNGDYILLLNPDTLVHRNTLNILSQYLHLNKDVGVVGCKVVYPDGKYQLSSKRHFPTLSIIVTLFLKLDKIFPKNRFFGKYNYTYLDENKLACVDAVSGSCMMFKKEILNDIGNFDENFFLYFEDTDFCYRAIKKDYKVVYNPDCKIVHHKRESFKNSNKNSDLEFYKSFYIFYNKYNFDYKNNFLIKLLFKFILGNYVKLLKFSSK